MKKYNAYKFFSELLEDLFAKLAWDEANGSTKMVTRIGNEAIFSWVSVAPPRNIMAMHPPIDEMNWLKCCPKVSSCIENEVGFEL